MKIKVEELKTANSQLQEMSSKAESLEKEKVDLKRAIDQLKSENLKLKSDLQEKETASKLSGTNEPLKTNLAADKDEPMETEDSSQVRSGKEEVGESTTEAPKEDKSATS